ncbi:unnamed protein product [Ambrosiozyma monospora]|uniref:Unnamed protein product n=1 Tax=Ambrosiozyma monospora TaxID=43982 RepID=A0A9W6YSL9_AMBMO|nr:unnamed protein product [Ambrosiozyma monospora]
MPIELLLGPVLRPVIRAHSYIVYPHRRSSRYVPHIIDLDESQCSEYVIRKRFGTGSKILDVFDAKDEGSSKVGPTDQSKSLFYFVRSRAVKGAYKMFSSDVKGTAANGDDEPVAALRAGMRSNVLLIRAPDAPVSELGWHIISHKVDALDAYRMFTLSDGNTYQWTTEGKFLERVKNLGEKESEVRERIAQVVPGGNGFNLIVDDSKIPRELALATALISFIDQWNTINHFGGIYFARQRWHASWKRD